VIDNIPLGLNDFGGSTDLGIKKLLNKTLTASEQTRLNSLEGQFDNIQAKQDVLELECLEYETRIMQLNSLFPG